MNSSKKILVVEDELPIRSALIEKLSREGFTMSEAANGEMGLIVAEHENPDLILLDINMPRLDGLGMLTALRATDWGKNTKVIVLTNSGESEKVAEALENGAFDFLVKSDWKIEDVVTKVCSVLV